MPRELKVTIEGIQNLQTTTKKVIRNEQAVIVTAVKFECETPAGKFDDVHEALKGNQPVDVMIACPQLAMDMGKKPDES